MGIGGGRRVIFGKMVVIKNSFLFPPLLYTTISPYLGQECNRRRKKRNIFLLSDPGIPRMGIIAWA